MNQFRHRHYLKWHVLFSLVTAFALCGLVLFQVHKVFFPAPKGQEHSDQVTTVATELKTLLKEPGDSPSLFERRSVQKERRTQIKSRFDLLKSLVSENHFQRTQIQIVENLWKKNLMADIQRQMDIFIYHEAHLKELKRSLAILSKVVDLDLHF